MVTPADNSRIPRVSVLLPVFNAANYLEDCLKSLQRQSCGDFEIIAVDDGSRDASPGILAEYAGGDSRLRVVTTPHQGLVFALNTGLRHCRAPLVARMDADDIAHPRRLELQLDWMDRQPELGVVSCLVCHFPRGDLARGFKIYEDWLNQLQNHGDILRERFIESPIPHPSVVIRRDILVDGGGYHDRGWPEDYDLWLRLAPRGVQFGKVKRKLLFWRHHAGRLTCQDRRYRVERFLECKAYHLAEGPLSDHRQAIVWGAGKTGRRLSKHLQRFGIHLPAFIDIDARKIGRTLRGVPIHDPADLPALTAEWPAAVVLAAVSSRGAREIIRRRLSELGLREGQAFWCVA